MVGRGVRNIITFIIAILVSVCISSGKSTGEHRLMAMFWNLENFFDWQDGGDSESDHDFSPSGSRHWTAKKFYSKCNAIAKSICWVQDSYGCLPDIIGVAEIENRGVLSRMISSTVLSKKGYKIIHYDSPDHRGIDVALLWRSETMELISSKSCHVDGLETRDILLVQMKERATEQEKAFVVVHLPSKFGGGKTAWKREKAAARLRDVVDSVYACGCSDITVMGDFNDTPSSDAFEVLKPLLVNVAESLDGIGKGTIRFDGKWDLIDMFWVSREMAQDVKMEIVQIPFLMVRDNVHSGVKPLRTYSGPRYLGGVSDHCPILLKY